MAKKDPKMTPSKPVGTGNTRLKFNNGPAIWPTEETKKANPKIDNSLFSQDALSSKMPTDGQYAAGAKTGYVDKKVVSVKMPNDLWPTDNY